MRISYMHFALIFLFSALLFGTALSVSAPQALAAGGCIDYYTSNIAVPPGYGAAYNLFSSGRELLVSVDCASSVPKVNAGSGSPSQYVYKTGYAYRGGTWQAISFSSSNTLVSSVWYTKSASADVPLTSQELADWSYVVGYVCTWNGTVWKCGCADTTCTTGMWQLQAFRKDTTTIGGGTGAHLFGTYNAQYAAGSIKPTNASKQQMDEAVRGFYDTYKSKYIKQGCGTGQYYIAAGGRNNSLTVSEAMGWGMVIVPYMAGYDANAQQIFDGLFRFARAHPATNRPNMMAWDIGTSCQTVGSYSAVDGDLDIAYGLLLADKQWGSSGAINYLAEAKKTISDIRANNVRYTDYFTMGLDDLGRSSDFMTGHFRAFQRATGDTTWTNVLNRTYAIIDQIQSRNSPNTGLLPDFINYPSGTPASPNRLESAYDGNYYWNANRDPWRIGIDFLTAGDSRARTASTRMASFFRTSTGGDPNKIWSGYYIGNGQPIATYNTMAFQAPVAVALMSEAGNQAFLNSLWGLMASKGSEEAYADAIRLQVMIIVSGNWWVP